MSKNKDTVKEYLGIVIDYSRDSLLPEQGIAMLTGKGFYKKEWEESPQETFARGATCYSFGDYEFAQRIYDYVSKNWFAFASPVQSNAVEINWPTFTEEQFEEAGDWLEENVTPEGMPISCFLSMIHDSKAGLLKASDEAKQLSMMGGGVGVWAANRSPDERSTGVMAHARDYDAMTLAYRQTACYTPDTRILTESGWKKFCEVVGDEKVAVVEDDGSINFELPLEWVNREYAGKLYTFRNENRGLKVSVTSNHKMVVERKRKGVWSGSFDLVQADNLKFHNEARFVTSGRFVGEANISPESQFLVALAADGYLSNSGNGWGVDFHLSKQRKIDRLEEILRKCGYEYTVTTGGSSTKFYVKVAQPQKGLEHLAPRTKSECLGIIEELAYWDGSFDNRLSDGTFTFSSKKKEEIDKVTEWCVLAGRGSRVYAPGKDGVWRIRITNRSAINLENVSAVVEDYNGPVSCCVVRTGKIVVEAGNVPLICGNTRRGSMAMYLDVDHPEIMSFLQMRNPIGGDSNKKCFNLNHGINITDKFMLAWIKGEQYELVDPKHGPTGRFLDAREVWEEILELRKETGEPYLLFKDTVNRNIPDWITKPTYRVSQSNLCVAPETLILTKNGYETISDLEDEVVHVWNGKEWSQTTVRKTGENQKLLTVKTNSGFELTCTPYHKFYVSVRDSSGRNLIIEKRTNELKPGDRLIKSDFPLIEGEEALENAYANGFYSGDGCLTRRGKRIYLYGEKRKLKAKFGDIFKSWTVQEDFDREYGESVYLKDKFFVPNCGYDVESRVNWFAGLCDSDGTVARNGKIQSIQVGNINKEFLLETQMMLQTLGISSKVTKSAEAGKRLLPLNDGSGELGYFDCKEAYRLLIGQTGINQLQALGFKPERLILTDYKPNRECSHFVKVTEVVDEGRHDDTYCFTEPKRHMGVFNGILTGQCSEITLMTSLKRTAVCCLSSLNLEKYDEWKDTNIVADLVRLLDNVLEYFIRLAPAELDRAIHSASKERAIGIGTLGWHSYLQSKMIPFEGGGYNSAIHYTNKVYGDLKAKGVAESKRLALLRGEAPDCAGSGMRNSHLMAVAPNASSSSIVGASPSIEPWSGNAFNAEGRAGSFLIKNKYLKALLESYGKDTSEVWSSIVTNDGSVQHLDFLSEHEKAVFKTAYEINPMWIIEQAAERQKYICQSQSVNLFLPADVTAQELSDIHFMAWLKGLKSLYYCRGKSAVKANIGTGADRPLNAVPVRAKIEYEGCLSCEG